MQQGIPFAISGMSCVHHSQGACVCVLTFQWYRRACGERISPVAVRTVAHRHVVVHPTFRAEAADAGARIHALVALTGLGPVTVRIDRTLWTAALVRVAEVIRQTRADAKTVVLPAYGISAAFAREAWLLLRNRCRSCCNGRGKITRMIVCLERSKVPK